MFIGLLSSIINASNHTKCVSLSNQKCMTQVILISLYPNKYSQGFHYYPFAVKLDRCVGSCKIPNDLSNKVCISNISNKTKNLNLCAFNVITYINESKTLTKPFSRGCKCKFDSTKCNSNQWRNCDKCRCECKNHHICEKDYFWNPAKCNFENGKYLASIMDDRVITCDEVLESYAKLSPKDDSEEIKNISTNFNEKKVACKTQIFYIFLTFLLITITLLIVVSICCCYLIKYQAKQKQLLPFHETKLKQFCVGNIN